MKPVLCVRLSRNFCGKIVRVKSSNFHTVSQRLFFILESTEESKEPGEVFEKHAEYVENEKNNFGLESENADQNLESTKNESNQNETNFRENETTEEGQGTYTHSVEI